MIMKNTLALLAALLLVSVATVTAVGTETNTAPVERKFQVLPRDLTGVVVSFDAQRGELAVRHRPTGYIMKLRVGNNARFSIWRQVDLDELPDNQPFGGWGPIDEKNKVFRSGIFHVQTDSPNLKLGISGNSLTGRLQRRPVSEQSNGLTTRDGKSELRLFDGQSAWALTRGHGSRPGVFRAEPGTAAELQPGREVELQYRADDPVSGGELLSAKISILFPGGPPYYMNTPAGPSKVTVAQIEEQVAEAVKSHAAKADEIALLMPVRMELTPELVKANEPVTLRVRALANKTPNAVLEFYPNYLKTNRAEKKELTLAWRATGEKEAGLDVYTAELKLPDAGLGQHLVQWACDIGGDIDLFWRSYAVIDDATSVCTFQINHLTKDLQEVLDQYALPHFYWSLQTLELKRWANPSAPAKAWAEMSRRERQGSGHVESVLNYAPWGEFNVLADSPEVQRAALKALQTVSALQGFESARSFWDYSMGTKTAALAKELGFRSVTSLCTENHIDGATPINHTGKPERPYFMAPDDFRRSGPGGRDGIVGIAQIQRHTILARRFMCDYCIEPGNQTLDAGGAGRDAWDEIAHSRAMDFFNAMFQMQQSQKVPFVIQQCAEFSGSRRGAAEGNRMMLHYAVDRLKRGEKVAVASARAVAEYYRRHYQQTPETTNYLQDYWTGFAGWQKPAAYPDVLEIENHLFAAMFVGGGILPEYHYDYTRPWNYPDFGNEGLPRKRDGFGYPDPDNYDRFAWTPSITDTRKMSAERKEEQSGGKLVVTLTLRSDQARKQFPLALWDLPRQWQAGEGWYRAGGGARFVPVKVPFTDNLSGVLVADLKAGENRLTLTIDSPPRTPATMDVAMGNLRGKVFERDGRAMAYVYPAVPWDTAFELTVPQGKSVQYYAAPKGERVDLPPGTHKLVINKERWSRIVGLNRDELAVNLKESKQ
jgi:hypothetical protein